MRLLFGAAAVLLLPFGAYPFAAAGKQENRGVV